MLSEETTLGEYPVEAVSVISKVAQKVESRMVFCRKDFGEAGKDSISNAVSDETVDLAQSIGAKYIAALTNTGFTAKMISRYRPAQNILAFTPNKETFNQLNLSYGCEPVLVAKIDSIEAAAPLVREHCLKTKTAKKNDIIVVVAGMQFNKNSSTNTIFVQKI